MPAVLPPTASSAPLLYSLYFVLPAYLGVCVCRAARKGGPRLADARAGALSGDRSRGRWSVSYGAGARQKTKKRRSATESGAPAMVEIAKRRNWGSERERDTYGAPSRVAEVCAGNGKKDAEAKLQCRRVRQPALATGPMILCLLPRREEGSDKATRD